MVIHLTQKLAKKLHVTNLGAWEGVTAPYAHWCANLFVANRAQYILTTNAATLFSVVIYGRGITNGHDYVTQFRSALAEQVDAHEMQFVFKRVIVPTMSEIAFAKVPNRSVLGSMNDMVVNCKWSVEMGDPVPLHLGRRVNTTPMGAIKYHYPLDEFARLQPEAKEST
jgi:hypothetical protein